MVIGVATFFLARPAPMMAALYQWMRERALPLWSAAISTGRAVVADTGIPFPLLFYFIAIVGVIWTLFFHPSRFEPPLPRRVRRRGLKRWFGGDAAVLAAKRGERPPTGARLGGGAGGGTSTITSSADEPTVSDPPTAAGPIPVLLATCSTGPILINKALTMKLFFVGVVLLASFTVAVEADRILFSSRRKAGGTAKEHVIDVARPGNHRVEEKQKKGEETVGEHSTFDGNLVRNVLHIVCYYWCTYVS